MELPPPSTGAHDLYKSPDKQKVQVSRRSNWACACLPAPNPSACCTPQGSHSSLRLSFLQAAQCVALQTLGDMAQELWVFLSGAGMGVGARGEKLGRTCVQSWAVAGSQRLSCC